MTAGSAIRLVGLVVVLATGVVLASLAGALGTLAVIAAVVAMIMLHELGHFLTAKASGMKVTEYFLGFGPRLWSFRRGETEYGVKAIPAGGYVKIIGMNNLEQVDPGDEARAYRQQPFLQRLVVASAGSAVHFMLAFLLLWSLLAVVGLTDYSKPLLQVGSLSRLTTGQSPAERAGFKVGETILSVNGRRFASWDQLVTYVRSRPGRKLDFAVSLHGTRRILKVVPVNLSAVQVKGGAPLAAKGKPTGFIGIGPTFATQRLGPLAAVGKAGVGLAQATVGTVQGLGNVFSFHGMASYVAQLASPAAKVPKSTPQFASPVGIVQLASYAAHSGMRSVLALLATINVFVGVFNMFPMLPLDGGHVAVAVYERARSRKGRQYHADVSKLLPAVYLVVVVILFLGVTSLYMNISHPLPNPFQFQ
ncbi:MAG: M50 family metallopeptidase [Acidimicrobiales bacterium]